MLLSDEFVAADGIYADVKCTCENADSAITASRIRARQESLLSRFKSFGVMTSRFRHGVEHYSTCFLQ